MKMIVMKKMMVMKMKMMMVMKQMKLKRRFIRTRYQEPPRIPSYVQLDQASSKPLVDHFHKLLSHIATTRESPCVLRAKDYWHKMGPSQQHAPPLQKAHDVE